MAKLNKAFQARMDEMQDLKGDLGDVTQGLDRILELLEVVAEEAGRIERVIEKRPELIGFRTHLTQLLGPLLMTSVVAPKKSGRPKKAQTTEEVSAPSEPEVKGEPQSRRSDRVVKIWPIIQPLLRSALAPDSSVEPPSSIEDALARYHGRELWQTKGFQIGSNHKKGTQYITFGEDLAKGNQSLIRRKLREAGEILLKIQRGEVNLNEVTPQVAKLYQEMRVKAEPARLIETYRKWGLPLE